MRALPYSVIDSTQIPWDSGVGLKSGRVGMSSVFDVSAVQ